MSVFTRFALRFRTVILLLVGILIGAGALAMTELDQELFPPVEAPFLLVTSDMQGASPSQIADDLTEPIEDAVEQGDDIEWVQSQSSDGFSVVFAEYTYGTDIDERRRELVDELADTSLPETAGDPSVQAISPNDLPVYEVAVTGDDNAVRAFSNDELRGELEDVDGVADILQGGADDLIVSVQLDPDELAAHERTIGDVITALEDADTTAPVGAVEDDEGQTETPIRVVGTPDEVTDIVVPSSAPPAPDQELSPEEAAELEEADEEPNEQIVRLGDVAGINEAADAHSNSISRFNGDDAALLQVVKEQEANTVGIVEEVEAAIDDLDEPSGVRVSTVTNQATGISDNVDDVTQDALLGALLALVVIAVFLRSGRGTVVAGVAIPLSLIGALAMMNGAGVSVNVLTLGALAVAAGRVIDDSIVVLENVSRHLEAGMPRPQAVWNGTKEVAGAVTAASVSTMLVFLPLGLISGLAAEVFTGFALTIVFALITSLLVALTVVPVLGSLLLNANGNGTETPDRGTPLRDAMHTVITGALNHRLLVAALAILAFAGSLGIATTLPMNLFPGTDSEYVDVGVDLPVDITTAEASDRLAEYESEIDDIDGVANYSVQLGNNGEDALTTVVGVDGDATATVELESGVIGETGRLDAIVDDLDLALDDTGLDGTIVPRELIPANERDLIIQLSGDDFALVEESTDEVFAALDDLDELEDVSTNLEESRDELAVELDDEQLAEYGLQPDGVVQLLATGFTGPTVASLPVGSDDRDVVVRFEDDTVTDAASLEELPLLPGVQLSDVGEVVDDESPTSVTRWDRSRSAEVTAQIGEDDIAAVNALVDEEIDDLELDDDVDVARIGITEEMDEVFGEMGIAMMIAVALTYLVLVGSFGSLVIPLIILLALPLAAIGAFPALAITGRDLGLPALIGLLMLIGIVVTNAIVLLSFVQQQRKAGLSVNQALVRATQIRVRPVLMTALTTIFALLPIGLGLSEGALLSAPLATVVIGGLITSTVLTLVVIPVVYSLISPPMRTYGEDLDGTDEDATTSVDDVTGAEEEPVVATTMIGRLDAAEEAEALRTYLVDHGFDQQRLEVRHVDEPEPDHPDRGVPGLAQPEGLRTQGTGYGVAVPDEMVDAVLATLRAGIGANPAHADQPAPQPTRRRRRR